MWAALPTCRRVRVASRREAASRSVKSIRRPEAQRSVASGSLMNIRVFMASLFCSLLSRSYGAMGN